MKYIFQFRRSFLLYYFLFKLEKNFNIYRFKINGRVGFFLFSQERKTDEKNNGYVVFIFKYPGITWEKDQFRRLEKKLSTTSLVLHCLLCAPRPPFTQ
jgi:hypothetical protein